jgi:hypothetical protein
VITDCFFMVELAIPCFFKCIFWVFFLVPFFIAFERCLFVRNICPLVFSFAVVFEFIPIS